MKTDIEGEKAQLWRLTYKTWIQKIREKYPKAPHYSFNYHFESIMRIGMLLLAGCAANLRDDKIVHFLYSKNGVGTPGHTYYGGGADGR